MSDGGYSFEDLPLNDIGPGTTVLVAGPTHGGTRSLGFRLLAGAQNEGVIIITTNQRASRVVSEVEQLGIHVSADRTAILDCVDGKSAGVPAQVLTVSGPSDLTGIGMRYSDVHRQFTRRDITQIRTGLCSLSTLLSFGELKTVSRFVHTLASRIDSTDGLGVFVIDPSMHDDRAVSTIAQFCSGRIDVRESESGSELRTRGLSNQPRDWTPFDL